MAAHNGSKTKIFDMAKILILDDTPSDYRFLSSLLTDNGYELVDWQDSNKTINQILAGSLNPDLVLITASSTRWDAFALCRRINQSRHFQIPIVLIHESRDKNQIEAGYDAGSDDYLIKPYIEQEIIGRIRHYVHTSEHPSCCKKEQDHGFAFQPIFENQSGHAESIPEKYLPSEIAKLETANTQLKIKTAELEEHCSFLRLIIDTIPYYVYARDREGNFIYANKSIGEVFNTTVDNIIGKNYSDINPDAKKVEKYRNEDRYVLDTLKEVRIEEERFDFNVVGQACWLSVVKLPIINPEGQANQVLAVMADITELKETELALRESEEKFRLAFEGGPLGMFLIDTDLRLIKVNRSFCDMLGYEEQELTGNSILDLIFPEDTHQDRQALLELFNNLRQEINTEKKYCSRQKRIIWTNFTARLIRNAEGEPLYVLGMIVDITSRKHTEEELEKHRRNLEMLVEQRTSELSLRNTELEKEIIERKRAEIAEREQRALAEALRDTAARLNSTLDLDCLLDLVLANIEQVVPHDAAQVLLLDQDTIRVARHKGNFKSDSNNPVFQSCFSNDRYFDLQEMIRSGNPFAVPDVTDVTRWILPMEMKWVRSYVGAPMKFGNKIIGFLCLYNARENFFGVKHGENLQAFANQASIAIRNARLYEQQRELAALEERQRLAREMHDAVSQTLFSACLKAETLSILWKRNPERIQQSLSDLYRLNRGALAEMRNLLVELRPQAIINADLSDLIRQLADGIKGRTQMDILVQSNGRHSQPADVQIAFFRIAQEALNNIEKHSQATEVLIFLDNQPEKVKLKIVDNGCGFEYDRIALERMGIKIMFERAETIQAKLNIESHRQAGTIIDVYWENSKAGEGINK